MSITEFYSGREIFVTGSTGFIGMALIEKLLRSCSTIKCIYVLMRPKQGQTIEERLTQQLEDPAYGRVRERDATLLQKVVPIAGDCTVLGLGISDVDLARLNNVTLVYHAAANVRFDDFLGNAVILNMRGTEELLKLAVRSMPKLCAFVHVSTSYSNTQYEVVEERMYPPTENWRTVIKLAERFDEQTLNILCNKYIGTFPNTYTFTKSLAEHIVNDYRHKLPVIIFRPSIVVSALREPYPGWFANFNGPLGLTVACGFGICSTIHGKRHEFMDLIPIDIVIRAMILTGYKRGLQSMGALKALPDADADANADAVAVKDEAEVVICAATKDHCITNHEYTELGFREATTNPYVRSIWTPSVLYTNCFYFYYLRLLILDLPRSILLDLIMRALGHQPFLMRTQRRLFDSNDMLYHFTSHSWHFKIDNFERLDKLIETASEFIEFSSPLPTMVFEDGFRIGLIGTKRFKFNEPLKATFGAKLRMRIYLTISFVLRTYVVWLLIKLVTGFLQNQYNNLLLIDD